MCSNFSLAYVESRRVVWKVKTASTRALLADFAWDVSFHPDLAQSDFHFLAHLKEILGATRMRTDEVKKRVKDWFNGLATDLYRNSSRDTGA
jgi:hypothetical protein